MVGAIRDITINEGLDPRDSLVRRRRWRRRHDDRDGSRRSSAATACSCPGRRRTLSACGGLFSDIVTEFSVSRRADTNRFDYAAVNRGLAHLAEQIEEFFGRLDTPADLRSSEFFVEARYPYQVWELEVPLAAGRFEGQADVDEMVEGFHRVHERVFAVSEPGQHIECIYWKGRATARLPKPELARAGADGAQPDPAEVRPSVVRSPGRAPDAVLPGGELSAGHRLVGPAII